MSNAKTWWLRAALVAGLGLGGLTAAVWSAADRPAPHMNVAEAVPVLALILTCAWLTVRAEPVLRYTSAAAKALHAPAAYIDAVLSTKPVPGPTRRMVDAEIAP